MKMTPKGLREAYETKCEEHNRLVAEIAAAEHKPHEAIARADVLMDELRTLEHQLEAADRDRDGKRQAAIAAVSSGDFQPDGQVPLVGDPVVRSSRSASTTLMSPSGKPQRYAAGPDARLLRRGERVPPFALGELLRGAAVGAGAWTPSEVRMQLSSDNNSSGGYAVPELWLADWIDKAIEQSVFAIRASRILMDSESVSVTIVEERPEIKTKQQLAKFNEATIAFGSRKLQSHTAGATVLASNELLEDAPNAAQQIQSVMLRAITDWFDRTLLNGSGSAEPTGILNRDGIPTEGSTGTLDWEQIGDAMVSVRSALYSPSLLVVSPAQLNQLYLLTTGDGTNAAKQYLEPPRHLEGIEVVSSVHCPDTKAVLCDPLQLLIGVRNGATAEASRTAGEAFERHATSLRVVMRADFVPTDGSAFYVLDGITEPN